MHHALLIPCLTCARKHAKDAKKKVSNSWLEEITLGGFRV
jgi:hypothetical protein